MDDTDEKVRSGEGHAEIAGVGDIDGEGEESRTGGEADCNASCSAMVIVAPRIAERYCQKSREILGR